MVHRRSSLLPAGVTEVVGAFGDGDAVELCGPDGTVIGRGLGQLLLERAPRPARRTTHELACEPRARYEREVIHRDDLVIL